MSPQVDNPQNAPTSIRWWTLAGLTGFAFVSYMERVNISIAAEIMMPALGLSKVQLGQIFTSFLIGYALFQVPGGWLGDRLGPRLTLAVSAFLWGAMTICTGLLPTLLGHTVLASFVALWFIRFILGMAEATTFPIGNRVVRNWMPPEKRAFGSSIMMLGTCSASAATGPLVSAMMLHLGWQKAFYVTSIPGFLIGVAWYTLARDTPALHPRTNAAERALISPGVTEDARPAPQASLPALLRKRNTILLVLSYVSEGYVLFIFVFWVYIYLVEKRGFSMMRGGWVSALPWLTALLLSPLGALVSDRIARGHGRMAGARAVIMAGYALSGGLLFLAAYAAAPWISVASLCLSIGFLMSAESSFWASAMHLAGDQVGALSGVMNASGIVGGIASTSLVPVMVAHFGWLPALASGALVALFCVLLWAFVADEPQQAPAL